MQKVEKIRLRMSSGVVWPVSESSAHSAAVEVDQDHLVGNVVGVGLGCVGQRGAGGGDGLLMAQAGEQTGLGGGSAGGQRQNPLAQCGNAFAGERRSGAARQRRQMQPRIDRPYPIAPSQVALVDGDDRRAALDGGQQARSSSLSGCVASSTTSTSAASASASRLRAMPSCSTSSSASRRPAVSTSSRGMPSREIRSVTRSRVVPGVAVTMARSRSTRRLKSELLPALGRPTMASVSPSWTMRPRANEASSAASGGVKFADAARDLGLRRHVNVVFGKVDARFEQRDQLHQRLLHRLHAPAERAAHLAGGLPRLRQRLRFDQVAHRLGLGQIELAGEKCALR